MLNNNSSPLKFKIVCSGHFQIGKTSLLLRFSNDYFTPIYIPTISIDFKLKNVEFNSEKFRIQIWEFPPERGWTSFPVSYRGADAAIIMYDITNRQSFESVINWIVEIPSRGGKEDIIVLIVGNKCDLEDQRVVSYQEGLELAERFSVGFFEASMKDNINIENIYLSLLSKYWDDNYKYPKKLRNESIDLENTRQYRRPDNSCC